MATCIRQDLRAGAAPGEHVRRHLRGARRGLWQSGVSGAIGWCAFDYNTHKDFGSGDRICHHGVMDMFREPKFAAFAYASQCEPSEEVIMKPVTFWPGATAISVASAADGADQLRGGRASLWRPPGQAARAGPQEFPQPAASAGGVRAQRLPRMNWAVGLRSGQWRIVGFVGGKPAIAMSFAADPVLTKLRSLPTGIRSTAASATASASWCAPSTRLGGSCPSFRADRSRDRGSGRSGGPQTALAAGWRHGLLDCDEARHDRHDRSDGPHWPAGRTAPYTKRPLTMRELPVGLLTNSRKCLTYSGCWFLQSSSTGTRVS